MISDDDLLLYHYRDGLDAAERARIGAALSEQPELAQRLQSARGAARCGRGDARSAGARADAAALAGGAASAQRGEGDRARTRRAGAFFMRRALAGGRGGGRGRRAGRDRPVRDADAAPIRRKRRRRAATAPTSRRLGLRARAEVAPREHRAAARRARQRHARGTRAAHRRPSSAQNRMYALAAERAGEPQLARVLRAFAPILESLSQGGGESTASSVAQLSFELRVMQGRLSADAHAAAPIHHACSQRNHS